MASSTSAPHLWLRAEVKAQEHRTPLPPAACAELLAAGFSITVEKSFPEEHRARCFPDAQYADAGCVMAEPGTWQTEAPRDAYILGLKELPEDGSDLKHKHIYFGHAYKNQGGWKDLLNRFNAGGGTLLDMEFLTNEDGRRVAAFGFMAGFAGAFVALDAWAAQKIGDAPLKAITPYPGEDALISYIKGRLAAAGGKPPTVMVMGALGRCGSGAVTLCEKAGLPADSILKWDMAETKAGGPFPAILGADVFVNCIYLSKPIPPFLSTDMLDSETRKLTVVCDVSCDTSNPHNPLPFCDKATTFVEPTFRIEPKAGAGPLDIVAIDHLPTLLPVESSTMYCNDLMPTIRELKEPGEEAAPVWIRARKLFEEKAALAKN
eukprot:m.66782 g.66782  ORF g.66782 m.66782 type:complete len:377 (-) comp13779_c0_seq2:147-1277(-)